MHSVRSSGYDSTKYTFQLRREGNSLSLKFYKADICCVQGLLALPLGSSLHAQ